MHIDVLAMSHRCQAMSYRCQAMTIDVLAMLHRCFGDVFGCISSMTLCLQPCIDDVIDALYAFRYCRCAFMSSMRHFCASMCHRGGIVLSFSGVSPFKKQGAEF